MLKRPKLRSALKKGKQNEGMWQKKINFKKKSQKLKKTKLKKKRCGNVSLSSMENLKTLKRPKRGQKNIWNNYKLM